MYRTAFLDWLACAVRGAREPAARAARAAGDVVFAGTAGHVLDFDDTYLPGLAHLSAPVAPAALVVGARGRASTEEVLAAYAAGFEAMGAFARAAHPALYEGGWHPTAVCGPVGAAVATARLLGLPEDRKRAAVGLALLRAGGLRSAFGSDGKALQVGMAAAQGVTCAELAEAGARVDLDSIASAPAGFTSSFGAQFAQPQPNEPPAIESNWIKAYPCCLQTHGAIEAALEARSQLPGDPEIIEVVVHPVSRRAAALDDVTDGLQAKFSIPYLTAFALLHGAPEVESFAAVDPAARALAAERIRVRTDEALLESEAVLVADGAELARITAALGSPERPMDAGALQAKVERLAGIDAEVLERPPAELLGLLSA